MARVRTALCVVIFAGFSPRLAAEPSTSLQTNADRLAAAITVGDCTHAKALTADRVLTPAEHLALADCASRSKDTETAREHLAEIPTDSPIVPWRAVLEVRLLLGPYAYDALLSPEDAKALLERAAGVTVPGVAGRAVKLATYRAQISLGEGLSVRPQLRAMLQGESAAEARYWLARAAELREDREPALATYRSSWAREVTSPWPAAAAKRLEAMEAPVPDVSSTEGRALVQKRAIALGKAYQAHEAFALWRLLDDVRTARSQDWQLTMAKACFAARDYACAVERYEAVGSPSLNIPGRDHTVFQHALATSRIGDYATAADRYRTIFETQAQAKQADQASFKIGYLDLDAGQWSAAIEGFAAHRKRYPSSRYSSESDWFTGWAQWRSAQPADAIASWAPLIRRGHTRYAPQAQYWTAVHSEQAGALEAVRADHPNSGAAWFAALRLGGSQANVTPTASTQKAAVDADPTAFQTLMGVGLLRFAGDEYSANGSVDRAQRAVDWLALGHAREAQRLVPGGCGSEALRQKNRSICWPRLHADVVEPIATAVGLPQLLPYAIMKAESGFRPAVTSPAGARGLMQLMPKVGLRVQASIDDKRPYDADDLYLGPYNALLGTSELALLYRHFLPHGKNEAVPLTIAAYNAGQGAVDKWLGEWEGPLAIDAFAASISYTETRRYVQKVLGYLSTYERVWADPSVDVEAPGQQR